MELVDRCNEVVAALRRNAEAAERDRRLPVETIEAVARTGLIRAFVPREFGGEERGLVETFTAVEALARGCSSTAWVSSLLATHALAIAWFDRATQAELWANGPDTTISSSVAPTGRITPTDAGVILDGRWSFVSGVDHAQWLMLGAVPAGPAVRDGYHMVLVRASEITIEDDWDVAGLRATGSKSVTVKDLFVPARRALQWSLVASGEAPGKVRHPWRSVFEAAFPPVALGTAAAAVESFRDYLAKRVNVFTGAKFGARQAHVLRLPRAQAELDSARGLFFKNLAELEAGSKRSPSHMAYQGAFVIDRCSHLIHDLFRGSGGRALYTKHPIQRHLRDIFAMTQHAALDLDHLGFEHGAALLEEGRA